MGALATSVSSNQHCNAMPGQAAGAAPQQPQEYGHKHCNAMLNLLRWNHRTNQGEPTVKLTNRQSTTKTLTDLYRALANSRVVTITYLKPGETEPTVRTIEIYELRTASLKVTKKRISGGGILIVAMCRLRGERREFHLSGVLSYTVHRMSYVLTMPENTTYEAPEPQPADDVQALFFYELARDPDDADYRPRVRLTQTSTELAA